MSQDNQITLRGYLTAEPKFYQKTATATPVTEIRVGSTPRRLNRETGEWQDAPTSYFTVKCWRRLAINAASSLHKGEMVIVRGRFYTNTWVDSQQQTRTTLEIEADSLGHDLAYGWSHFLRGVRQQQRDLTAGERGDGGELARQDTELPSEADETNELDETREADEISGGREGREALGAEEVSGTFGGREVREVLDVNEVTGNSETMAIDGDREISGTNFAAAEPGLSALAASVPEHEAVPF